MKKLILLILFLGVISVSFGQLIPKVGMTVSNNTTFYNGTDFNYKWKTGFMVGIAYNKNLGKSGISVQPELLFIQKGTNSEYMNGSEHWKAKIRINSFEVPVLFKYSFGKTTRFYLNVGPSFGLMIGGNYESTNISGSSDNSSGKLDEFKFTSENLNRRKDIGAQFGGGIVLANKVIIDIRYGLGLTYIKPLGISEKYSALQLSIGIPLKK